MRILGIDYGDARIGLAISDEMRILATALEPYKPQSMRKSIDYISDFAKNSDVDLIVVGLPLNMNGTEGPQANKVRAFAENLKKVSGIEVVMKDERLTTVYVERAFSETGIKKSKQKNFVDSASAQVILQNYIDSLKFQRRD